MKTVTHDNRQRFADTFSKHWKPHTITIDGFVVWSGNDVAEVPQNVIQELESAASDISLGQLIGIVARGLM